MTVAATVAPADQDGIEFLWEGDLAESHAAYLDAGAAAPVALAAALVEIAIREQGLGGPAARAAPLLVADLCLARASRLLACEAPVPVQIAFARVVEEAATAAAQGRPQPPVRERLVAATRAA